LAPNTSDAAYRKLDLHGEGTAVGQSGGDPDAKGMAEARVLAQLPHLLPHRVEELEVHADKAQHAFERALV